MVASHYHLRSYQERFFMQGTIDYSGYCAVPAALAFVKSIGGFEAVRKYNFGLVIWAAYVCPSLSPPLLFPETNPCRPPLPMCCTARIGRHLFWHVWLAFLQELAALWHTELLVEPRLCASMCMVRAPLEVRCGSLSKRGLALICMRGWVALIGAGCSAGTLVGEGALTAPWLLNIFRRCLCPFFSGRGSCPLEAPSRRQTLTTGTVFFLVMSRSRCFPTVFSNLCWLR